MEEVHVIVANYKASNKDSFLAYLDELSAKRQDGGMLHGGHIHYIQGKMGEDGFILKAAISSVLDLVPNVFPLDLPEIVEKNPDFEPTEAMNKAFQEINDGLILPVGGGEILEIIKLAREYASLQRGEYAA